MSQMDVRRLVRALALGGLVILLVGGGIGFAAADAAAGQPPAVAFPRPGDSVTYSVEEFHVGPAQGELKIDSYTLTWMPEAWVIGEDYRLRLAHPLMSEFRSPNTYQVREAYYDAVTGEAIVVSGEGRFYVDTMGIDCNGSVDCRFRYDFYDRPGGPCGARNALQDGQPVSSPLRITGNCDYVDGAEEMVYEHVGSTNVAGYATEEFRDPGRKEFAAWFSPGLPLPVRFTTTLSDNVYYGFLGHERMYDMRLESFTPGTGVYSRPLPGAADAEGPGPVPLVPRSPLLFDFAGYPFPLAFPDAYAAALADTGENGLAPFMSAHPDAYVAESYATEWLDGNGAPNHAWYFVVTDGDAWKSVAVRQGPMRQSVLGIPLNGPSGLGTSTWVESWALGSEQAQERDTGRYYPPPSLLPDRLPLPTEILARQQFVQNQAQEDARYLSWLITCATPACLQSEALIGAGHQQKQELAATVPGVMPGDSEGALTILYVDVLGAPIRRWAFTYDQSEPYDPLGTHAADESYDLAPVTIRRDAGLWLAPTAPAAATGVSLLAILASAVYYFWPAVKGGALGLFSRIEPDRVLDHPARKDLLAVVEANPGIHFQELVRRTKFGRGQLEHHLRKLEGAELVSRVKGDSYACFFARGQVDRRVMAAAPLLRSDGGRSVLAALQQRPGATSRQLGVQLGLSPGTVSYHVKRLREAGMLESAGGALHLTETGRQATGLAAA